MLSAGCLAIPAAFTLCHVASSPESWPRATFKLDPALSEPGNIYRAQLLVTPKADSCEEFWAMNPSGPGTNNTCGGQSTGEPYREVRLVESLCVCSQQVRCCCLPHMCDYVQHRLQPDASDQFAPRFAHLEGSYRHCRAARLVGCAKHVSAAQDCPGLAAGSCSK